MTTTCPTRRWPPARHRNPVLARAVLAAAAVLLAAAPGARAVPFTADLVVSVVEVDFDDGFALADGNVVQSGSFSVREGGVDTTSFFTGATVDGGSSDPLTGSLTDIGDGVGITADSTSEEFGLGGIGIDATIALANVSATDTLQVSFRVDFANIVDTEGVEAYATSEYTADDSGGEVFFTDVVSDLLFGDELAGELLGTFGELVEDAGFEIFDVVLGPGATETLEIAYTAEASAFDEFSDVAVVDFSAFIGIDEVRNLTTPPSVPEPGTLVLLGGALAASSALRRRRARGARAAR